MRSWSRLLWRSLVNPPWATRISLPAFLLMNADTPFMTLISSPQKTARKARSFSLHGKLSFYMSVFVKFRCLKVFNYSHAFFFPCMKVSWHLEGEKQDALRKFQGQVQERVGWYSGGVASNWSYRDGYRCYSKPCQLSTSSLQSGCFSDVYSSMGGDFTRYHLGLWFRVILHTIFHVLNLLMLGYQMICYFVEPMWWIMNVYL